jgi:metal-responsive CopG/Arc/MetJ family transcriptional regulator
MKVQISINDELLERADNFADENYMSRSGLIAQALNQYLTQAEVAIAVKNMALSLRKIADTGQLDDEAIKQFEDYERIAKMYSGQ